MAQELGRQIAEARKESKKSLRALAEEIGLSASYLNDIEHGRRVPSEQAILDLARALGMDSDAMLAKAGRVGEGAEQYLRTQPTAGLLLRKASAARLNEEDLQKLIVTTDQIIQDRNSRN